MNRNWSATLPLVGVAVVTTFMVFAYLSSHYANWTAGSANIDEVAPIESHPCISTKSDAYAKLLRNIRENVLIPPPPESERRVQEPGKFHSQMGQDKFVNEKIFNSQTNRTFVEAGALDGVQFSNTLYFEETFGWTGLLVEPDPWTFTKLRAAKRNAWLVHGCLGSHRSETQELTLNTNSGDGTGKAIAYLKEFGDKHRIWNEYVSNETDVKVTCYPLNLLLDAIGWTHIDYFSLDVEGAEAAVLHSIDYDRYSFGVIDIECNNCVNGEGEWVGGTGKQDLLEKRYYTRTHLQFEGYDEVYYKDQDIFYLPRSKRS